LPGEHHPPRARHPRRAAEPLAARRRGQRPRRHRPHRRLSAGPFIANVDFRARSRRMEREEATMKYLILIYGDEKVWASMPKEEMEKLYAEYQAYTRDLRDAGAFVDGHELRPTTTATSVRVRGGKVQTTDGPFAETKEQ